MIVPEAVNATASRICTQLTFTEATENGDWEMQSTHMVDVRMSRKGNYVVTLRMDCVYSDCQSESDTTEYIISLSGEVLDLHFID